MPYLNYSLLAWGTKSNEIELLQKKAIRVLYSKSPIAFFKYLKTQFVRSYSNLCNLNDCFVCANSN